MSKLSRNATIVWKGIVLVLLGNWGTLAGKCQAWKPIFNHRAHRLEKENQLLKVVLYPEHIACGVVTCICVCNTHIYTIN